MALPAQVEYATVTAVLTSAVVDGSDPDLLPDAVPLSGQVTFTADRVNGQLLVPTATPPLMVTVQPMPFLLAGDGSFSANLVVIPGATYTVSFALNGGVTIAPFSIGPLVAGQTYDLASLAPVPAVSGIGVEYIIGATGATGPEGPIGPTGATGSTTATTDASLLTSGTLADARLGVGSNATTVAAKAPLASPAFTGTPTGLLKTHVGLGNVDNTSDAAKPVSAAVTALVSGSFVGTTDTQTLTNKRITSRVGTVASSATPTPDANANDLFTVTALAVAATFAAPTGTPTDGQRLVLRVKDNATARALSWNAAYRVVGAVLPTTTVISKTLYVGCVYNGADALWDVLAVGVQA